MTSPWPSPGLGEDPGLARFIDSLAERVGGSVVAPELDDLGAAVVCSQLGSRRGDDGSGARPRRPLSAGSTWRHRRALSRATTSGA